MRDNGTYGTAYFHAMRPEMCEKRGWTRRDTERMTSRLRTRLLEDFPLRQICRAELDNPLMSDDARACIVNEVRRTHQTRSEAAVSSHLGRYPRTCAKPYQEAA